MDYLIDCVFCPVTQRLYLLGGTFDGCIKVIHVNAVRQCESASSSAPYLLGRTAHQPLFPWQAETAM